MSKEIIEICRPYSMISDARFENNIQSLQTVQNNKISGDIVEIGVWKGGSILSMILAYEKYKENRRTFHLYDTFSGMTSPTAIDKDLHNNDASALMAVSDVVQAKAELDEVKENIARHTNYKKIKYHKGDILKNKFFPKKIAILRLDTDWYESTKHELDNFYDKVVSGGIVIVDDYGWWEGCEKAVDEFLKLHPEIKMQKIQDVTGIYFIKP